MDDILNNRSKLAEKIIDVLNNDVKTQNSIENLISKYDEKQNRIFWRNWKNKIGYAIFTIIIAL